MSQQNRRTGGLGRKSQVARKQQAKIKARKFLLESLEQRTVLASSITGGVYLDANNDGVRGAGEYGVPGVQITLTGTDSSNNAVTRTTLTSDSGAWTFDGLADGTYTVTERQPTAMMDGTDSSSYGGSVVGNDVISSIAVSGSQSVSGMNFGERGILPQYIGPQWQFASSGSQEALFRETIAQAEALAGNAQLAADIRAGGSSNTNVAPVGAADTYSTTSGTALTIAAANGVLANDTDANGDTLSATLVSNVTSGTLSLNANGSFTYTPASGFTGAATFTYRASDGALTSAVTTVTINVTAPNTAPVATNDTYNATEDTALTVNAATGVLANDTDANGNSLTAAVVTGPTNGTLTLNANGSFTYTPNANFNGTDTFTYRANDGTANSANATVTITVAAVNDAPVAVADAYNAVVDTQLVVPVATGVLANDTDVENSTLTAVAVTQPTNGTLTLNANGSFTYTPNTGFTGTDTFTYRASDGTADSAVATVTITVAAPNVAPVAVADSYNATEDTTLTINAATGVLANDTDADSDPLTAAIVTQPTNGTLTLNADGSFTYVPNANFNGTDTFTYRANDGTVNSGNATVTITVAAVNDAPVAANDSYSTAEDTALNIAVPGVLANDTDVDSATLTAVVVTQPTSGTLTLNANGSYTYTPNTGFTGTDSFTYRANDGTADSNIATVTITVGAANQTPVAVADSYNATEDTTLNVNSATGVLANDTDGNNDTLMATLVTGTTNGTLQLNSDGSFSYVPNANFSGTDSFTYTASDGQATSAAVTVTITIAAVNDAPVAGDDAYTTDEDTTLTIALPGVLANDTDAEDDDLTVTVVDQPVHGTLTLNADGSFNYVPFLDFSGTDTFTYRASDGNSQSNLATVTITITPVEDAPDADDDAYTVAEDGTLTVNAATGVLANDTDAEDDNLTAVLVDQPTNGTLTLNADGSFTYTPDENFSGTDTFTYRANDGTADSNLATVTITVTAVNDAPVAVDDAYSTGVDEPLVIALPGVLANDTDVDDDDLTAAIVDQPTSGTLTLNADGSFTYTPNSGFQGTDTFTYRANDGTVDSAVATVTITVNTAPVAVGDNYSTDEDTPLTIVLPGVLGNDTDADDDDLTAVVVDQPTNGTLTLNADGSFTYTPDENFSGTDTFTYRASDGFANSNLATVTITVDPVNDAPQAVADSYSTPTDTALVVGGAGVLGNDTDVDGDDLTAVVVDQPTSGTLDFNADGTFTYTPNSGFQGTDTFTYQANDSLANSNVVTVTITVNNAPVATGDAYTTDEDTELVVTLPGVLTNDTDADDDDLTAVIVDQPTSGTLTLNADGSFTYTPDDDFSGTDTFTYRASDGISDSNLATVTITVTAVNDTPVATDDSYTTAEDTELVVTLPGVLTNETDADDDDLTAVVVDQPTNGTLTLNADGSFTYTPDANFSGTDTFTYRANDGTVDSNLATVTITVTAVNDAPVATDDAYTTDEDTELVISLPGVLANDTDVEDDDLTAVIVDQPTSGTLTLNADGSFTYTPDENFSGTDTFTYRANDGTVDSNLATVTITVTAVNDTPVATDDSYTTAEDTELVVTLLGVLANDTDADDDDLTAIIVDQPTNGTLTLNADGSFSYTPDTGFSGTDTFTYRANDGTVDSNLATVTITVTAVNDAPVATDDAYTTDEDNALVIALPGVLANDTDAEDDDLTAVIVDQPTSGTLTLNADGSFTYTPDENFSGTDTFTYRANDGVSDSNLATVTITVTAVNDTPVATDDSYTTAEDTELVVALPGVLANDTDADDDDLTAIIVDQPTNGTLTLNADGSFSYTPDTGFIGTDTFTYRANDGTVDSNLATVTITVTAVNDAPVATDDAYTTDEDNALVIALPGVLANDTDAEVDDLTAVVVDQPTNGTLTLNADGSFTYTPDENFSGTDTFTYRANDGVSDSNLATVTITVVALIDAPIATDDSYTTAEDTELVVTLPGVLANDTDADDDELTAAVVDQPTNGTLTLNADGSFSYTPDTGFIGTDTFTYRANDGTVDSNLATVTITVTAVNDAPVATDDAYTTDEDTELVVTLPGVLSNDTDSEDDDLTAVIVDQPTSGTLTLNADGSFTYTPDENFSGTDTFTYRANDGTADSNLATVTITVTAVNDVPVGSNKTYDATENVPLVVDAASGVLAGATDVENDSLTAVLVGTPVGGTVDLNTDGSFTFTPTADFSGTASFEFAINDGTGDSITYTATIDVIAVEENSAPVAVGDSYTVDEDTVLTVDALTGLLANDTDADDDTLTIEIVDAPASGILNLAVDGSFTYTPALNVNGPITFTYKLSDGIAQSNVVTVTISITAINDAPEGANLAFATDENTPLSISAPGLLAGSSDIDGDTSLTTSKATDPANGTVTVNPDGSFLYTPNSGFIGTDSFTYIVSDGGLDSDPATVTIEVGAAEGEPWMGSVIDEIFGSGEDWAS